MENLVTIEKINKILSYDFDYYKEISNLETDNIDLLDIDLTEEQYISIHNNIHCHIIHQNMTIVDKTKDKIKKDFHIKIQEIISLDDYQDNFDFSNTLLDNWKDLFSEFRIQDYFLNRLFILSYSDKFESWFDYCRKNNTNGFFGSVLLHTYYPYSHHLQKDDFFLNFINTSDIITGNKIEDMINFLYTSHPKNKNNIDSFIKNIFNSLFTHTFDNTETKDDLIKKSLELGYLMKNLNIQLENDYFENFRKKITSELDKFLRLKNDIYIQKNIDLIFTYHSIFNNNALKIICEGLYQKDKVPFVENEFLKRTIKQDERHISKKKRL